MEIPISEWNIFAVVVVTTVVQMVAAVGMFIIGWSIFAVVVVATVVQMVAVVGVCSSKWSVVVVVLVVVTGINGGSGGNVL